MSRKRKKIKQQRSRLNNKISPLELIKEMLTLFGGLAGSILAIYGLLKTFRDDVEGFWGLIPIGIIIWTIILLQLWKVRKLTAKSLLIISILIGVIWWAGWQSKLQTYENKIVVLITQFDGPEEKYGLQRQVLEDLHEATRGYDDVVIIENDRIVTSSNVAQELGNKENADIVIWAWYRPTEDPNITIHFENLSPTEIDHLGESETYKPQSTLADLESFEIQRKIGSESGTLISFLSGLIRLRAGDHKIAIQRFESILVEKDISTYINPADLYFFIGLSYGILGNYNLSIQNSDNAIELDSDYIGAYGNRGNAYMNLGLYEIAIENYNKVLSLDPDSYLAFLNRGNAYIFLEEYYAAIDDFNKAIALNPNGSNGYLNRGVALSNLGDYENAINDYNRAISLDPKKGTAYFNRGLVYQKLGNLEKAQADFKRFEELTKQPP